jgi:thymidylate synthase ThyX
MISARIVADSRNPNGNRLTSFILTYPRFIHSEFMTHRIFSRNAASSRAIPLPKMLDAIEKEPALPEHWGAEQKGMASGEELAGVELHNVKASWFGAMKNAVHSAKAVAAKRLHKSLANRLVEPFSHITVLATASDLSNFFALRAHPIAQPEFQVLAYRMLKAYINSTPVEKFWGDWHIPHFGNMEGVASGDILKVATARCARLSYLTFDGSYSPQEDIALHDRLIGPPFHASPFEHCARAVIGLYPKSNFDPLEDGEYAGWRQYRKDFSKECPRNFTSAELSAIMGDKPDWITL